MTRIIFVVVLLVAVSFVDGRHVHPRSIVKTTEMEMDEGNQNTDEISVDVLRNIKPNRFVPINNVLFFKSYAPCEEGFERDLLGVCREVWD